METLRLSVAGGDVDFAEAREAAEQFIIDRITDPILIAWYDGKRNEEHPKVPECQHKPGWLSYAEGHGGRLRVDINEDEYSFIFAESR